MSPTAVITGATGSLGLACVKSLLAGSGDWQVVFAVRDPERGRAAIAALPAELRATERCSADVLDLASLRSVGAFVERHRGSRIDALVCNAGMQLAGDELQLTEDGVELTFQANHLGHFALVEGVLGELPERARVIVVASDTHDPAVRTGMPHPVYVTAERLAHPGSGDALSGRARYTTSKLCNVLFVHELDRRLRAAGRTVTANAFNPGLMPGTGLARDAGALQRFAWDRVMPMLRFLPMVRTPEQSGADLARLVADPALAGASGRYFDGHRDIRSSQASYDRALALDLWETSAALVAAASPAG